MTPIIGILESAKSGHLWSPEGAYDALATVTLSSSTATITFAGIPTGYKHLQIRTMALTTVSGGSPQIRFNSDSGNNYSNHILYGSGTAAATGVNTSISGMYFGGSNTGTSTTNPFVSITDILDYANTNKNTTIRTLSGLDANGNGEISLFSGAWYNTAAVTSIDIYATSRTFAQYSQFALYGVK